MRHSQKKRLCRIFLSLCLIDEFFESFRWHGPGKIVTLDRVAVPVLKKFRLLGIFHTLGDHRKVQAVHHVDDLGEDDLRAGGFPECP